MSTPELSADELTLPIKRTDGDTIEERLTGNAYHNILPARYLKKDADGNLAEDQEDLFERVAENIALAEAVYEAEKRDVEIAVRPDQVKPDHPRRDELAEEVFGAGTTAEADVETPLTEHNVNKFAYETVVPELPGGVREHVEEVAGEFQEMMERLSFMPNCVPPDSLVASGGGLKPLTDIEPGERVYDDEDGDARVESKFENGEKRVVELETATGYSVRATPEHYFRVITSSGEYEWRQVNEIDPDDVLAVQKNFLDDDGAPSELNPIGLTDGGAAVDGPTTNSVGRSRGEFNAPDTMTPELAEWLGLYVGDGTARESGVRVAFDERDANAFEQWASLTESVFGFEPTSRTRTDAECTIGQAYRRDLYAFLEANDLLKQTSKTATVPGPVLESGGACISNFLRGLFEADGTVGKRAIELYTHSKPLARQVQKLLLGLGIRSKLREKDDGYRVGIRKNVCGKRFVERVGFISDRKRTDAERFADVAANATSIKIPNQTERLHEWFQESDLGHDAYRDLSQFLISPDSEYHQEISKRMFRKYAEKYPELWDSPVAEFVQRDQFYETVSEIRDVGTMAVEDMQVPRRNTYVVDGFVSHNSPTLMNAGDELQQLSACFVDSPEDDLTDIHQTAKEAAEVFQCLTEDATVHLDGEGIVSVADVEPGDKIRQRDGDEYRTRTVEETHAYQDAPVDRVVTTAGVELTGTPNHELLVNDEWRRIDEIDAGDTLSIRLGWIEDEDEMEPLETTATGGQWGTNRGVSNDDIISLYSEGYSDYEIAERLDCSASTVQRRRSNELDLPPNGSGGRDKGSVSFDTATFDRLYEAGRSDREIAAQLDVHQTTVGQYRASKSLEPNGEPAKTVTQPTTLTPDLAELLGMWVGDGSKHEDGIRFHLNREESLEHADRLCRHLFDEGLDWRFEDGCYDAVLHSHEIRRFWLANFGDAKPDAPSASVPEQLRRADHETITAFLRGLFSTDGGLQKGRYPRLWSASESLIDGVQQLLLGIGIPAARWELDSENRDYYNLGPTGELGLTGFAERVGFVDTRDDELAESLEDAIFRGTTFGEIRDESTWAVPVERVEDAGTDTVYDVTVEGDHEYLADSVVSHNSGGGMGYAFWRLRPYGDAVGSTGGIASGPITFMETFDQMCETIAQGGARRGAQMAIMRVSHPDVIEFIHSKRKDVSLAHQLKLNDPDDFTYTTFSEALEESRELIDEDGKVPEHLRNAVEGHLSNFNISVGVTDGFMEALQNGEEYTFTNPRTGEPHVASEETEEMYSRYDLGEYVEPGEELSIPAEVLWERIVAGAHENGEPGVVYLDRINDEHSFPVESTPTGDGSKYEILATNPSLAAGTRVLTDQGVIDIEELEGKRTEVPTLNGGWADAICRRSGDDEPLYEVELANGKTYLTTEEHKWPVLNDDSYERTKTTEIGEGARLPIEHRKSLRYGSKGDRDDGFLVGWLYGDGSVTHRKDGRTQYGFTFSNEDATAGVMDRVLNTLEDITGVDYTPNKRKRDGEPWYEVHASHAALRNLMSEFGVDKKSEGIPEAIWNDASESFRKGFIDGLFSADGYVDSGEHRIVLVSATETLIKDVSDLLGFYGLKTSLRDSEVEKWGSTHERWDLKLSRTQAHKFRETFDLTHEGKAASLAELKTPDRDNVLSDNTEIVAVRKSDKSGPVWDLRVDDETHTFALSHALTGNCGEQPLMEYEACNLGHINLSTVADTNAPDWRVWSDRNRDEYDSLEDAVDAFLADAIDREEFDHRIEWGTRFLENVVTMSNFPVEKIEETVRNNRKVGLGIMGLAQLYIQLGVAYGSEVANEIARQLMVDINHGSKWTSHELAGDRDSFANWADSKYANPTEYADWFERMTGLDAEEWGEGFPIRNHNTTTIAPTGCVEENSLVSTDEGLVPIKDLDETTAEFEQWNEIEVGVSTDGGTKAATAVYDNGFADVRRIETEGGFSVASTPDHRFRTITDDGEYVWQEAAEFESGDRILLQRGTFDSGPRATLDTSERRNYHWNSDEQLELPSEMTPELAEFLGYFMGDGYVHEDVGVKLVVESDAQGLDAYLRKLGESVFGVSPTVEDRDTRHVLMFGGRHLPRYFEDNGWKKADGNEGEGAASAFVPDEVLQGNEAVAKAFLRGLFEADGTASRKVELSTVSETLADQVQTLLLALGCVFVRDTLETADRNDHYGDRPRHSVRGANKREDQRFLEEVGFITKSTEFDLTPQSHKNDTYPPAVVDSLRDVSGYDSVSKPVKNRVNQSPINGSVSRKLVRDIEEETGETVRIDGRPLVDFYAATVGSVTEETAYTKDISVPSNNTYVANGFVTHNTTSMVGNTSGGCEPIYNVAYYKNVSDDVQGDEMLVEFDDYFLRVLEDNDIPIEAVKEEAKEQMATNSFDGVDGLTTVPDAIGELFVTTSDLSAKGHASVQCACQVGVDSAISKTTNAPNDSTVEDAAEVFEYIYENGGKGVTYYRDGTRSKQVLTTRAQNTEFSDMDEDEATEALLERVEDVFGGMEEFLAREDVRGAIEADVAEIFDIDVDAGVDYSEKRPRPDVLHGVTQRIETGYGKLYVNINEDERGQPFELFATIGNSGGFTNSFTEALAKTVSTALRSGVDPDEIADELQGIRSPKVAWDKGEQIQSIPDAVGTAMRRYLDGDIDPAYPQQRTLEETAEDDGASETVEEREARANLEEAEANAEPDGGVQAAPAGDTASDDASQSLIDAGESPECPECGSMSLHFSEGCKTCEACGWSEC